MTDILEQIPTAWGGHRQFAQWLPAQFEDPTIVDLGVDFGYSTFCFALANKGHVWGVDSFEGDEHAGFKNTLDFVQNAQKALNVTNLTLVQGYFQDVAKTWDKSIDILHIDGRHHFEDIQEDFDTWSQFVKPNGIVLMHDTMVDGFGVGRFFQSLGWPKLNFWNSHGLGVVSRNTELLNNIRTNFAHLLV